MTDREAILELFREALPKHPVVWTSSRTSLGDFEGRDFTLEVFDVPWTEKRALLGDLLPQRTRAENVFGRPVQLLFHTPEATDAHYSWVREEHAARQLSRIAQEHAKRTTSDLRAGRRAALEDIDPLLNLHGSDRKRVA